ncbi:hypothetical protein GCM10011391_13930 [Pullulanibacillus camelliae]|uniref:Plasmid pRiA4b Orf3-like domain-containing protein n=1 Tax=Pullulanibacillus camelliae TaxID=1707096 RepID=A0A8J2VPT0_9BACL|nr:hypothetical protein [Pullulanibacillus camelliae]GGE36324.1 hypothetical protein GCM10011391_13930 [Pullulanibacillus camelliae]
MIYQFKITLMHAEPPIWRTVQIDSRASFEELHEVIQIAFQWMDVHLHDFRIRVHVKNRDVYKKIMKEAAQPFRLSICYKRAICHRSYY